MKKAIYLFVALFFATAAIKAQPCSTFENPGPQGSWINLFCAVSYGSPNPFDGSQYITLSDQPGGSWFQNTQDFRNLGTNYLHQCLCFDYNVGDDGFPGTSVVIHPTLYMSMGSQYIYFVATATVVEGSTWVHVCAPIELSSPGSLSLPGNADGQWMMPAGYTTTDFDNIITGCDQISFLVDVAGSSYQTERVSLDNICVKSCGGCNSSFLLQTYSNTNPSISGYIGEVTLNVTNPGSTYLVDWGDMTPPTTPYISHVYPGPGTYVVCVTEYQNQKPVCKTCMSFCFGKAYDVNVVPGEGDPVESGGAVGKMGLINAVVPDVLDKTFHEDQYVIYPNPSKDFAELKLNLTKKDRVSIRLMDLFGNVVSDVTNKTFEAGSQKVKINTENIPSGVYTVEITVGEKVNTVKLSVVK